MEEHSTGGNEARSLWTWCENMMRLFTLYTRIIPISLYLLIWDFSGILSKLQK